ncbi:MAG: type II toxin-antitoxin system Phd/YefM family antitoxin [Deltaproteobacteria bacterium]|nr:MAG: type II toxin-antitoxin system Phd/YefM family antitoxin [Deltaproteobacteria bacterium]
MQTITATEFKARCLELMDRVCERGETYLITKRGRRVAQLAPVHLQRSTSVLGCLRGRMEIVGDLVGPPASEAAWNATLREWDDLNATRVGTGRRRTRRRR